MSQLSSAARRWLLGLARSAIIAASRVERFHIPEPPDELSAADRQELERSASAFVSLHKQGNLRGCVGHISFDVPLIRVIAEMAQAAAREDTRFTPVLPDEVPAIDIEISLLSSSFPIRPEEIVPGTHGLMVRRGLHRGLLLPQVASAYNWDSLRFLRETCRKAGLPPDAWERGAAIEAFTAEVIAENDPHKATHTAP